MTGVSILASFDTFWPLANVNTILDSLGLGDAVASAHSLWGWYQRIKWPGVQPDLINMIVSGHSNGGINSQSFTRD